MQAMTKFTIFGSIGFFLFTIFGSLRMYEYLLEHGFDSITAFAGTVALVTTLVTLYLVLVNAHKKNVKTPITFHVSFVLFFAMLCWAIVQK